MSFVRRFASAQRANSLHFWILQVHVSGSDRCLAALSCYIFRYNRVL